MNEKVKSSKTPVGAILIARTSKAFPKEQGITLIALIIMIIVLVIIAAVAIKGITNGGLMSTVETAAQDYTATSYKE